MFVILLTMLQLGCRSEEPYDLSQVPMKEVESDSELKVQATVDDDNKPALVMENSCVPPGQNGLPIAVGDTVQVTLKVPANAAGKQVLVDFILPEYGEVKYSVVCKGTDLRFPIPQMLGKVSVVVFIDEAEDGPSATDAQGIKHDFEITTENVDLGTIELNDSLGSLYHFGQENREQPDPILDMPAREEKP